MSIHLDPNESREAESKPMGAVVVILGMAVFIAAVFMCAAVAR